ncbi:hypothetical protein OQX63_04895 [Pedobacter sp. PF22-3]|uniref:hypothetical protein n=1 Tax=Pedobacter sp. PF22-3 TaxID=2994467 RepID=UPI0022460995|nr:hypothetical protein [Pedobacter sp. PF22-3]MCX2492796.1 hypothetical protein [Pedobacter sp. PF22-3]
MEQLFTKDLAEKTKLNYKVIEKYLEPKADHFLSLSSLRLEILKTLMLELFQASIFATNHFLERLIKLALIQKYTLGVTYAQPELYNKLTDEAITKYDRLILLDSLKLALKEGLLSQQEFDQLEDVKNKIRNPYSHAETKKIIKDAPAKFSGFMFSFEEVKNSLKSGEDVKLGQKTQITTLSSTFSQLYQQEFSREIALSYFDLIFKTMLSINRKLDLFSA